MNTRTVIVIGIALFIIIDVIWFLAISKKEENQFSTYTEAEQSGLMKKGWIPAFIPKSSYNIKETHRADTPSIHVELNFQPGDLGRFEENCQLEQTQTYTCDNDGYPVRVTINHDHAVIQSITDSN